VTSRWVCPHCDHAAIVKSGESIESSTAICTLSASDGPWLAITQFITCPNPKCQLTTIHLTWGRAIRGKQGNYEFVAGAAKSSRIRPASKAKPLAPCVPEAIRQDFLEAHGILEASPKAAATLARRALQGMIRDFWRVKKKTLALEIKAIKDRVDPLTWKAVDAVRGVGNIGAHMEKDINLIVDVDPHEAERLLGLIEMLVRDWYVTRDERQKDLTAIVDLGQEKQKQRKSNSGAPASTETNAGSSSS